jgi:hypothetical protein
MGGVPLHALETVVFEAGASETDTLQQLFAVRGTVRLRDGRVAVANRGTGDLRVFLASGEFQRSIGRRGSGPEEFGSLFNLFGCADDTLVVYEGRSLATVSNTERVSRKAPVPGHPAGRSTNAVAVSDDCSRVLIESGALSNPPQGRAVEQQVELIWMTADSSDRPAAAPVPLDGPVVAGVSHAGQQLTMIVPWREMALWAVSRDTLYVTRADAYRVDVYDPDGRLTRSIIWNDELPPVTRADRSFYEEQRRLMSAVDPDFAQRFVPLSRFSNIPATRRPFTRIAAGGGALWALPAPSLSAGVPWVEAPVDVAGSEWLVFDLDGVLAGRLLVPPGFRPIQFDTRHLTGTYRDDMDITRVRVYEVPPALVARLRN